MVAGLELANRRANLFDHPRGFVAQDGGCRPLPQAINKMEVAVTDSGRRSPHQNLAILRLIDINLLNAERLVRTMVNSGFHRRPSLRLICSSSIARAVGISSAEAGFKVTPGRFSLVRDYQTSAGPDHTSCGRESPTVRYSLMANSVRSLPSGSTLGPLVLWHVSVVGG